MMNRRKFCRHSVQAAGGFLMCPLLPSPAAPPEETEQKLIVLHTNDMHSHLMPFPMDGSAYQGLGGVSSRAELIKKIRAENEQVLLLDAGDIFGATPYFSYFKGEPEMKAMSLMKYDAVTIGDHDFGAGINNYANQLERFANFPVVICNYNLSGTPLNEKVLPYQIFIKGALKVGVTGVGIDLQGLMADELFAGITYLNPVVQANKTADYLKEKEKCDFIICLSHLGDKYSDGKVSDDVLARQTDNIDLIIGAHTHHFFEQPLKYINKSGKEVIVNQVGWAGIQLGFLEYHFLKNNKKLLNTKTFLIGKKYED